MEPEQAFNADRDAARERLKGFCKPAIQCKDNFDPARMHRAMYGNEPGPRTISWKELERTLRNY